MLLRQEIGRQVPDRPVRLRRDRDLIHVAIDRGYTALLAVERRLARLQAARPSAGLPPHNADRVVAPVLPWLTRLFIRTRRDRHRRHLAQLRRPNRHRRPATPRSCQNPTTGMPLHHQTTCSAPDYDRARRTLLVAAA